MFGSRPMDLERVSENSCSDARWIKFFVRAGAFLEYASAIDYLFYFGRWPNSSYWIQQISFLSFYTCMIV